MRACHHLIISFLRVDILFKFAHEVSVGKHCANEIDIANEADNNIFLQNSKSKCLYIHIKTRDLNMLIVTHILSMFIF